MKRYLLLLFAVLGAACTRLEPEASVYTDTEVEFLAEESGTKTVFSSPEGNSYPVLWTSDDSAVAVSLNKEAPVDAEVTASPDGKSATFSVSFSAQAESYTFSSISPAVASEGVSGGAWTVSIPEEQNPSSTSVDPRAQVMAAVSATSSALPSKVSLKYGHLASYLKLTLSNLNLEGESLSSVTVTAGDATLAGSMKWYPVAVDGHQAGEVVVLSANASSSVKVSATSADNIWIATLPADLSGKTLKVTARGGDVTAQRTVTLPDDRKLSSGKVVSLTVDMASAEVKKSISILAIGNSFSVDGMQYLPYILKQLGYNDIYLGNLYLGGCSLETHASNITSGATSYTYYTSTGAGWTAHSGSTITAGITDHAWDYVSIQQVSQYSGKPETYEPYLSTIVSYVKSKCPGTSLVWHMIWPYQQSSNYSQFANYGYSQSAMYSAITDAVKSKILTRGDFVKVIPSGTAVQNVRRSYIGDNTSRDGYHLNYGVGRLTAAMTWAAAITGSDLASVTWKPDSKYRVTDRDVAAIKDAVAKACAKPYEISEAADTDYKYEANSELAAVAAAAGYNMSNYSELPYTLVEYGYYNSTASAIVTSVPNGGTASNIANFACSAAFFGKSDLPAGTLLVLKSGWQYRPEGWTEFRNKNASSARPANVSTQVVEISDSWWGSFKYRAFNISKTTSAAITESEMATIRSNFAIFVPKH